jgi:hypothetical protein
MYDDAMPCLALTHYTCYNTDAIVGRRSLDGGSDGAEGGGVQQRVLSTILNELDGVDTGPPHSLSRARYLASSLCRHV